MPRVRDDLASIGIAELAGTQTVERTVTNTSGRRIIFRPHVEAPAGYDVDVVISRTFVYGSLAVFITGVYVAAVVGSLSAHNSSPVSISKPTTRQST